jgi:peptidoglycan/xylan/chitin deacetylase (PgdA/CDA1 family)
LTSIARKYNTTPRSIAYWNRETYPTLDPDSNKYAPNNIQLGWKLRLIPGVTLEDQGPLPSKRSGVPVPSGSRPPPPSTPADGSALLVANGDRKSNEVVLTFDLGGDIDPTLDVINWLIQNAVPASFAVNGQTASSSDVGKKAMQLIGAHPDLFDVINYSWDGSAYTELTDSQIQDQLRLTEDAISTALGRSSKPLFRPPLGAQDAHVRSAAGIAGWTYMIMWDVDTLDSKAPDEGGPTADDITARVLSRVQGGSIVLMHAGGANTAPALPSTVAGLNQRGLQPVTISELLNL